MISAIISGFTLGLSLILVIGAQNAFVLRQGLRNENVLATCLTCALCDAILILTGIYAFSHAAEHLPQIIPYMKIGGAIYLYFYGLRSFILAWKSDDALMPADQHSLEYVGTTILKCLTLSWLNPHVYLDTVFLIGSVSTSYGENRHFFGLGAVMASFFFFFSLGYFSRLLRPVLSKPVAWRIMEVGIGIIMIILATSLVF